MVKEKRNESYQHFYIKFKLDIKLEFDEDAFQLEF